MSNNNSNYTFSPPVKNTSNTLIHRRSSVLDHVRNSSSLERHDYTPVALTRRLNMNKNNSTIRNTSREPRDQKRMQSYNKVSQSL